jgi:DCN1-like protein 1/2
MLVCRLLELASAIAMWGLLFSGRQSWPFTEQWCKFLDEKHGRPINHDTWKQLLEFKKVRRLRTCACA